MTAKYCPSLNLFLGGRAAVNAAAHDSPKSDIKIKHTVTHRIPSFQHSRCSTTLREPDMSQHENLHANSWSLRELPGVQLARASPLNDSPRCRHCASHTLRLRRFDALNDTATQMIGGAQRHTGESTVAQRHCESDDSKRSTICVSQTLRNTSISPLVRNR